MAMTFELGGQTQLAYAVVLGARGGDLLGPAGNEALALERSVIESHRAVRLSAGTVVGTIGWNNERVNVVIKNAVDVDYFTALAASNSVNLQILPQKGTLTPGQVVGWLSVSQGVDPRVPLTVVHRLTPYTLLQRLR
jgi:hypothetical protein